MKQLTSLMLALTVLSVLFTACEPDPVDPVSPTLSIEQGGNFVSDGDDVFTESTFQIKITATGGDGLINRIEVQENGTAVDFGRLLFDGDPAGSNPSPIAETLGGGFTWVITVTAPSEASANANYTVMVTDANSKTASSSVEVNIVEAKPAIVVVEEEGFVKSGDNVLSVLTFDVKIEVTPGAGELTTIEVQENGTALDVTRLQIDGTEATANPETVPNTAGFTSVLTITAPAEKGQMFTYSIIVSDNNGKSETVEVEVSTLDLSVMTMVLLKNQSGPSGTGGVDLHTGESTGTQASDTNADLRDQGIDLGAPSNDLNWIQKIAPINNSVLKVPAMGFSFDEVETADQITTAFDAGTEIAESDKVIIGDEFLVQSDGTTFAIQVTDIVVTPDDNDDRYILNVKF
ncbi:MAG: hypothetical protein AAF587_24010 [Bacteroidota bacterium]